MKQQQNSVTVYRMYNPPSFRNLTLFKKYALIFVLFLIVCGKYTYSNVKDLMEAKNINLMIEHAPKHTVQEHIQIRSTLNVASKFRTGGAHAGLKKNIG
jgi:hypothetical protein